MGDGVADGRLDVVGLGHFRTLKLLNVEDLPAGVDIGEAGETLQLVLKSRQRSLTLSLYRYSKSSMSTLPKQHFFTFENTIASSNQ